MWTPGHCKACGHPAETALGDECRKHRDQREANAGQVKACPLCPENPGRWPRVLVQGEVTWITCPGCHGSAQVYFEYDGVTYHAYTGNDH